MNSPFVPEGAAPTRLYKAGTLRYTSFGLFSMMIWMLWGDFIWTIMEGILGGIMPFLLESLGASNTTIQLLSRVLSFVLTFAMSPMVSFSSDRCRSRRGRRIPYMLWTTPFVGIALVLIGFYRDITHWLVGSDGTFLGMPMATMYVVTFGVLLVAYDVFNIFVNDVYYYLFNDVVPEKYFTQFQAVFRMVGVGAGAMYSAWIFPYMLVQDWQWVHGWDNFKLVLVAAGIAYGIGFMVMCYMVREGRYPPPPPLDDARKGQPGRCERVLKYCGIRGVGRWLDTFGIQIKTYFKECFTHKYYWYFFLSNMSLWMSYNIGTFVGLRNVRTLGVSMSEIGWLGALTGVLSFILLYPAGWLADKFHPVRVYMVLMVVCATNGLIQCVWIGYDFGHDWNLYLLVILNLGYLPLRTVRDLASGPMYMLLLPRDRYGQFCSANNMFRAFPSIFGALLTGLLMDALQYGNATLHIKAMGYWAYRWWPVWDLFWTVLGIYFFFLMYRIWKKGGGASGFVPPDVSAKAAA